MVTRDNCDSFEGKQLQSPVQSRRCHFIQTRMRVHRYHDGRLAVFHGPRKLAKFEPDGFLAPTDECASADVRCRAASGR